MSSRRRSKKTGHISFPIFERSSREFQVATWEQMYREWMATMERRVNNLQVTNEELQVKIK